MTNIHRERMDPQESFGIDTSQRPDRWHPRITPFRLLTLGTTIALGTAKAVETYQKAIYVSVTLEWILGVVVFTMWVYSSSISVCYLQSCFIRLYLIGCLENTKVADSKYLSWLFSPDCMGAVWWFLAFVGLPRPTYSCQERSTNIHSFQRQPPVTGYSVLITIFLMIFGTNKLLASYFGTSHAATTIDWLMSVVFASM